MGNRRRFAGLILFILYLIVLADVLFLLRGSAMHIPLADYARLNTNLTPFRTIKGYLYALEHYGISGGGMIWWHNLAGNLVLFLPMGILLPALFPPFRSFFRTVLFTILLIVCVEGAQLFTRTGSCDVDDLILNTAGCVAGYVIYRLTFGLTQGRS